MIEIPTKLYTFQMEGMKSELDRLSTIRQEMSAIHERADKLKVSLGKSAV
jgi:hypothetical protein